MHFSFLLPLFAALAVAHDAGRQVAARELLDLNEDAALPHALSKDLNHRLLARELNGVIRRDLNAHKVFPAKAALKAVQPTALTIDVPVDHFSSSNTKTFANRYWINATYYKAGGPVFLQDVGESTVSDDFVQSYLMEAFSASAVMQLAKKYNGLGLMIEHRFYGESMPYPVDEETGLPPDGYEAFQYLTTEQALEDVVYIANNFKPSGLDNYWSQLSPSQVPWIFIGGSYSGNRAAWIRIRNPDTIYASWASSAPVQTTLNMATYYEQVYKDMTTNCSNDLFGASKYLTDVLNGGTDQEKAIVTILSNLAQSPQNVSAVSRLSDQQILTAYEGANVTDWGVAYNIGNFIGSSLQSYGFALTILPYCNKAESFDPTQIDKSNIGALIKSVFGNTLGAAPPSVGLAGKYGDEYSFYAIVYAIYREYVDALQAQSSQSQTTDYSAIRDGVAWTYQTCTEFGYFQVSNESSPYNLLSPFINVTSWQQYQCNDNFGYFSTFPSTPDVQKNVNKYGGWKMNPSQIMFTDGLKDPWHSLSVQSESVEIGAPNRQSTNSVPACGQSASNSQVFGLTYPNGYHVSDLLGSTGYAAQGLNLFEKALDTWVPCFQKHTVNSTATTTSGDGSSGTGSSGASSASPSKTGAATTLVVNAQLITVGALMAAYLFV